MPIDKIGDRSVLTSNKESAINCIDQVNANKEISNKKSKITKYQDIVKVNNNRTLAWNGFNKALNKYLSNASDLRGALVSQSLSSVDNIFDSKIVSLSSSDSNKNPNTYIEISALPNTALGSYSITISNLCSPEKNTIGPFSSLNENIVDGIMGNFSPGSFAINGKNNQTINLTDGNNLLEINNKIKNYSHLTEVDSYIVNVGTANYYLVLKSKNPGQNNAHKIIDLGALSNVNISNQSALNAKFTFDESQIERGSNIINDIFIDNSLIITLKQETTNNLVIYLKIETDKQTIANKILQFVESHNELMEFIYYQKEKDFNSNYKDTAILGPLKEFQTIADEIKWLISSKILGLKEKSSITDIGFNIELDLGDTQNSPINKVTSKDRDNKEIIKNLEQNINQIRNIFEFSFTASSPDSIKLYNRNGIYKCNKISLDIDISRPNIMLGTVSVQDKVRVLVDGTSYRINFEDKDKNGDAKKIPVIRGLPATPIENLELLYFGQGQEIVEINISQGIADLIYSKINQITKTNNILIPMNLIDIVAEAEANGLNEQEIIILKEQNLDGYYYDSNGNMRLINKEVTPIIEKVKQDYNDENRQKQEFVESLKQNLVEREQFFLEACSRSKILVEQANRQIEQIQIIDKAKYAN